MVREGPGDWTAAGGLAYEIPLQPGQRITLSVTGSPLQDSTVTLSPDLFQ